MKRCLTLLFLAACFSCATTADPEAPPEDLGEVESRLTGEQATLSPAADTYVRGGELANYNFGARLSLEVRNDPLPNQDRNLLLRFDLRPLNSIKITKAILKLNLNYLPAPTTLKYFGVDDDSWQELGVTYNTLPPDSKYSALGTLNINVSQLNSYVAFDVTSFTEAQRAQDGQVSFGVDEILRRTAAFSSREGTAPPQLDVTYDTAPGCNPGCTGGKVCQGGNCVCPWPQVDCNGTCINPPNPKQGFMQACQCNVQCVTGDCCGGLCKRAIGESCAGNDGNAGVRVNSPYCCSGFCTLPGPNNGGNGDCVP